MGSAIPRGCVETLARRGSGAPACRPEGLCDHVRKHPDSVVSFYFNLLKYAPGASEAWPLATKLHNRMCVSELLRAEGVTRQEPNNDLNDVAVSASFDQARAAFDLAIVNDIELGCRSDDVCTHCAGLSEPQMPARAVLRAPPVVRRSTPRGLRHLRPADTELVPGGKRGTMKLNSWLSARGSRAGWKTDPRHR